MSRTEAAAPSSPPAQSAGPGGTGPSLGLVASMVGVLAGVVGFVGSWRPSLWSDEVATLSAAERSPAQLWALVQQLDAVHATYYALVHAWTSLVGTSPVALRLPSALAVAAAAAGTVVLGSRLADLRTGAVAGAALALLPRAAWAATEARPWALTLAVAVWAGVALHAALERPSWRRWVVYGVLGALGVAVNVYLVLLWLAHGLTVALVRRDRLGAWILTGAVAAVPVAGVGWLALHQSGQLGAGDLGALALVRSVVVNQWFLGDTPTPTSGAGASDPAAWKYAAVALAALGWVLALLGAWRSRTRRPALLAWALPWLLVPTAALVGLAVADPSLYNPRYLTFCAPALCLLVAAGAVSLPRRAAVAVGVAAVLLVAPVWASQRGTLAKSGADLALVAEQLRARARPGDAVYWGPRDDAVDGTVRRSLRTVALGYPGSVEGLVDVTLAQDPARGRTLFGTSRELAASIAQLKDVGTVWVVRRQDRVDEAARDDALLATMGFRPVWSWRGSQTEVVEMRR